MPRLLTLAAALLAVASVDFSPAVARTPLLDPITTYPNGMPLASSSPLRSSNVNYKCDPYHIGCCGGRYNRPCRNSLLRPHTCCTGSRAQPPEGWRPPLEGQLTGIEPAGMVQLGAIPVADGEGGPRRPSPGRPSSAPEARATPLPTIPAVDGLLNLLPQ